MIRLVGSLGSLFIAFVLLSPTLVLHSLMPIYVTTALVFILLIAGSIMTIFAIWGVSDLYKINNISKKLAITGTFMLLIPVLLVLFFFQCLPPKGFPCFLTIFSMIGLFFTLIFLLVNIFKELYKGTEIYFFLLSARFLVFSIFLIPLFALLIWLFPEVFYNVKFPPEFEIIQKAFGFTRVIIAIVLSILISYGMIVTSFLFLALGFLQIDFKKEEEKILQEGETNTTTNAG